MPKSIETKLIEEFKDRESFSREELFEFLCSFDPELKEGTFAWKIYDLKEKNIIRPLKRGRYSISSKPVYQPKLSPELVRLARRVAENFQGVQFCMWEAEWLHEFTLHQANRSMVLIEIEKEFIESLYFDIRDSSRLDVFLNPDDKTMNYYVAESDSPLIIKRLISRSPMLQQKEKKVNIYLPTLEKMLVDLFAEETLFYYLQGSELIHIYEHAIDHYSINFSTLFNYAKRRGKEEEIKQFLTNHMPHLIKHVLS